MSKSKCVWLNGVQWMWRKVIQCNEWESNQWKVIGESTWMEMYDGKRQRLISDDVQWICDKVINWEWVREWLVNE